ncbi:MAG: glycosyltransferase family 2 protein [Thermoanaerobaculum sp.]|nr:glycosyltransferase family 2 protein [Thermoanaerobaculum sp.]MDW7968179.1 glycosyltransferase family 2 protein [Thermoanaerobaculum sp.]
MQETGAQGSVAVSIILVTWRSGDELTHCLTSLAASRQRCPHPLQLIVVDNGGTVGLAEMLHQTWSDSLLVTNEQNRGFAAAANQGAKLAQGEILLFLNPDTVAVGEPFSPLLEGFASIPEAVALAPRLEDAGEVAEAHLTFQLRRLPHWGQAMRELLLIDKLFPLNRYFARDRYLGQSREEPFPVEQPAAAALALRREAFFRLGGFDEGFFPAWFEDVDLCARLWRLGPIYFWPHSRFVHIGGRAKDLLGYHQFLPLYYANAIRYWRKHHGYLAALGFRALLALGMLLRVAALLFRPAVPRRRAEALRAYAGTFLLALTPLALHSRRPAGCGSPPAPGGSAAPGTTTAPKPVPPPGGIPSLPA